MLHKVVDIKMFCSQLVSIISYSIDFHFNFWQTAFVQPFQIFSALHYVSLNFSQSCKHISIFIHKNTHMCTYTQRLTQRVCMWAHICPYIILHSVWHIHTDIKVDICECIGDIANVCIWQCQPNKTFNESI